MKRISLIGVAIAVLVWALLVRLGDRPQQAEGGSDRVVPDRLSVEQEGEIQVMRGSRFDQYYGTGTSTGREDLRMLGEVLLDVQLVVKEFAFRPLGDNQDFVRFLTGDNSHRLAWIPPDHPRVDSQDRLLDRWGTPVFFHRLSATTTALRSAGPDRELWTDDDILLDGTDALWEPDER